jgi:hypothetical protein
MTSSEGNPTGRVGKIERIGDEHGFTLFDAENRALATFRFGDAMEALHHETVLRAILRRATAVVAPRDVVEARDEIARLRRAMVEARNIVGEASDALEGKDVPVGWIAPPVKN